MEADCSQRISRRVIAEQHIALTETFHSPWHFPETKLDPTVEFVGEVFLRCNAKEVVERCAETTRQLMKQAYGPDTSIPEIKVQGHVDATFPYIQSHLEYILGELLRNSIQAVIEQRPFEGEPPPIDVLICESPQHVIIRISDQGGGIAREILPHLWSFSKGPRRKTRLENLTKVPKLAATMQELQVSENKSADAAPNQPGPKPKDSKPSETSLSSLTSRPPELRLGIGLPMSRIYAEYWAGKLELHSLEGYGVDVFLQISKLGNKNEQLTTRASMDAV
jgi:pyruvate dehydrogenase kinase 2/3/4